jgi:hypothetical protein
MAKQTDTELTNDDRFLMLLEVLAQRKDDTITPEVLEKLLASNATAVQKAMKPENETHPGLSALSYPEGDRARPRPVIPYEFFYNNYPMHKFPETEHWRELELACEVQPGTYTVIRRDGSRMTVEVRGERNADGKLTKVSVEFPVSREDKGLIPPKTVVLYQVIHNEHPKKAFVEAMTEHLQLVMGVEEVSA